MNQITRAAIIVLFAWVAPFALQATSLLPITTARHIQISAAVFRGTVVDIQSYEDPADSQIYTRTVIRVDEVFKGALPPLVKLVHRGGSVGDRGEMDGFAPHFTVGEERLLFVSRRADRTLYATRGGASALRLPGATTNASGSPFADNQALLKELRSQTAAGPLSGSDLTDQAAAPQLLTPQIRPSGPVPSLSPSSSATNLITGDDNIPARFVLPDRGEPIPYLIDADYLPTGISTNQAISAVQTALAVWTNATSVRYRFAGLQSFGAAAPNIAASDGVLRIQLHDHYGFIAGGSSTGDVLGDGGHGWVIPSPLSSGWTLGGNVAGNDFHQVVRGYLVLQNTNAVMQTLSTFTEVLCHEIGHTIGLAHSSESYPEPNPILSQAIMYWLAHADGRGATLNSFDTNTSRQVHPPSNTPPYCYNRVMDIVTTPAPINVPGVNVVQLRGYDLQNSPLTLATTDATTMNGAFTVASSNITYVPNGFGDAARFDPASTGYYDVIYGRYSDGVHASPYATIRVISYNSDSYSEGIPDSWRLTYFGNADPSVGLKHHAADDADGDGYSNLKEYLLGSNPTSAASNLRITSFGTTNLQWQAKGYEVYEVLASTNFTTWKRALNPQVPTNSTGTATGFTNGVGPRQFFRIVKVP